MAYVLTPRRSMQRDIHRVARERLGDAIERLDAVIARDDPDIETAIHEVRKRCKETRGLARLVRSALGDDFRPFDTLVRSAANELSAMRDAHALLATFDTLLAAQLDDSDPSLRLIRDHQAMLAAAVTASVEAGDDRLPRARELLAEALSKSQCWRIPKGFDPLSQGLTATYRLGRRWLDRAQTKPTDHRLHEWRKVEKYLWYQLRLLRDASPSVLGSIIGQLDDLADALGDDHDLAVLVEQLDADPERFGPPDAVAHARRLARDQQVELRSRAFRSGAVIFAEPEQAFVSRIESYWRLSVDDGPERPTGGIATLAALAAESTADEPAIERERKFLVDEIPADLDLSDAVKLRQGYLAASERASVRVRDAGSEGCTLTVKAGGGAERVELEWPIERVSFEAAWPFTEGRRVVKTRHRIPTDGHLLELDVFGGDLSGLVLVEVEFTSRASLDVFTPPHWFGRELTDDARYTNASLALSGLPTASQ